MTDLLAFVGRWAADQTPATFGRTVLSLFGIFILGWIGLSILAQSAMAAINLYLVPRLRRAQRTTRKAHRR